MGTTGNMPFWHHKGISVKILYIENYLPAELGHILPESEDIFLRFFLNYLQFTISEGLKVWIPSVPEKADDDIKHGGLIISILILNALPVISTSISPYCMLTCIGKFLTEQYNYILIMQNNISHSSMLLQKHFITFAFVTTYFLSKSVCSRNKTFLKTRSKISKVLKQGWQCKLGYLVSFIRIV